MYRYNCPFCLLMPNFVDVKDKHRKFAIIIAKMRTLQLTCSLCQGMPNSNILHLTCAYAYQSIFIIFRHKSHASTWCARPVRHTIEKSRDIFVKYLYIQKMLTFQAERSLKDTSPQCPYYLPRVRSCLYCFLNQRAHTLNSN